jgi:hypothetical protein
MKAAGAQFGARILELRRRGFSIENVMERAADGQTHSWYILYGEPHETPKLFPESPTENTYSDPEEEAWS